MNALQTGLSGLQQHLTADLGTWLQNNQKLIIMNLAAPTILLAAWLLVFQLLLIAFLNVSRYLRIAQHEYFNFNSEICNFVNFRVISITATPPIFLSVRQRSSRLSAKLELRDSRHTKW